jgi:hypothetical protein
VIAARRIDKGWSRFVIDDGKLTDGASPANLATQALADLPRGARLCCGAGWLTLSIPGDLDPSRASDLTARLDQLTA